MGKKKFIDKKKAATFGLMFRDSNDPTASENDRVFVRLDEGQNHVPGFSDDFRPSHEGSAGGSDDDDWRDKDDSSTSDESDGDRVERGRSSGRNEEASSSRYKASRSRSRASSLGFWGVQRQIGPLPDHVRTEIAELGLPDDGYDYTQHLRVVGSGKILGAFMPAENFNYSLRADVKAYDASRLKSQPARLAESAELGQTLEILDVVSASTRPVQSGDGELNILFDEDVAAALEVGEGAEVGTDDELEDDFVMMALAGEDSDGVGEAEGKQSKDERSVSLLATGNGNRLEGMEEEEEGEDVSEYDDWVTDEEDGHMELGSGGRGQREGIERPKRLLDEQFENLALREYDDSEFGDLEDDDPEARGRANIAQFGSILDEFLKEKPPTQDTTYQALAMTREALTDRHFGADGQLSGLKSEAGNKAGGLVNGEPLVPGTGAVAQGQRVGLEEEEEEDVFIEDEEEEEREQWDCESIVSTYSNTDNHPARIGAPAGRRSSRPSSAADGDSGLVPGLIRLEGKMQLPVDYLPRRGPAGRSRAKLLLPVLEEGAEKRAAKLEKGAAKAKETPEEKKLRKAALKEERRDARANKKALKGLYRGEAKRAQRGAALAAPQGLHLP